MSQECTADGYFRSLCGALQPIGLLCAWPSHSSARRVYAPASLRPLHLTLPRPRPRPAARARAPPPWSGAAPLAATAMRTPARRRSNCGANPTQSLAQHRRSKRPALLHQWSHSPHSALPKRRAVADAKCVRIVCAVSVLVSVSDGGLHDRVVVRCACLFGACTVRHRELVHKRRRQYRKSAPYNARSIAPNFASSAANCAAR